MADSDRDPQPLQNTVAISNPDGTPTQYFIRWAQARQFAISGSITAAQCVEIIDQFLADHPLVAGTGITLTSSGNIADGVTIAAEVQAILDQISTTQGAVLFRGAADWQALGPGTAGQFLQTAGAGANPLWAAAGGGGGGSSIYPVTAMPTFSTWVNQGATTLTTNADGSLTLLSTPDGSGNIRGIFKTLPAAPWSYKIGFIPSFSATNAQIAGVALRESSSGKLVVFGAYRDTSGPLWVAMNFPSPSSAQTNVLVPAAPFFMTSPVYLSLSDNGTTRTAKMGWEPWSQYFLNYSFANNTYIVPDQIGIVTFNVAAGWNLSSTFFSWT